MHGCHKFYAYTSSDFTQILKADMTKNLTVEMYYWYVSQRMASTIEVLVVSVSSQLMCCLTRTDFNCQSELRMKIAQGVFLLQLMPPSRHQLL